MNVSIRATRQGKMPCDDRVVLDPSVFKPYVQQLAGLVTANMIADPVTHQTELVAALDGQPSRELRNLYPPESLRNTGTYFTGSALANRLVTPVVDLLPKAEQVVDPACGAGDLLVACARHLPLKSDLVKTLKHWGKRLAGFDINSAFVEATRYRLVLLAMDRIGTAADELSAKLPFDKLFPNIIRKSGMEDWNLPATPSLIVVNPPFSYGVATKDCSWAKGRVSQAASFVDACLKNASQGTRVLAILPDVLRTGTRYGRWRQIVSDKAKIHSVQIAGQFDDLTEINVFLLELEIGKVETNQHGDWACLPRSGASTVKDFFDVRVGPVVPFRLDGTGPWCSYAHSEELPPWETVGALNQHIRFNGTTYKPPFVAIRRTSKADYHLRCIGTLVTGQTTIAVENHLLLALPHDKKLSTCEKLLELLKRDSTSAWMNQRIRCRHLTVGSVGDLPWLEAE